jgi:hypothetical protein
MIKNKAQAFAYHCGLDASDVKDYRYHYGRTSLAVWSIDNEFYCVTKNNERPAVHRDGMEWQWVTEANPVLDAYGYIIWISVTN